MGLHAQGFAGYPPGLGDGASMSVGSVEVNGFSVTHGPFSSPSPFSGAPTGSSAFRAFGESYRLEVQNDQAQIDVVTSSTANVSGSRNSTASASTELVTTLKVDNRDLYLSRDGARNEIYNLAGTMALTTGDTCYDVYQETAPGDEYNIGYFGSGIYARFRPNFLSSEPPQIWDTPGPYPVWSWNPSDWLDTWGLHTKKIEYSTRVWKIWQERYEGPARPVSTYSTTYSTTNPSDGFTDSAVYRLNIHEWYGENAVERFRRETYSGLQELTLPFEAQEAKEYPISWTGSKTETITFQASTNFGKWMAETIGWTVGGSFAASYASTMGFPPTTRVMRIGETARLVYINLYWQVNGDADEYDEGGLVGRKDYDYLQPRPPYCSVLIQYHYGGESEMPPYDYYDSY